MKLRKGLGLGLMTVGAITGGFAVERPADAFVVHNGWNYSIDTYNDSTPFDANGNGLYEIFGTAYRVVDDTVTVAISSNVNLENGVDSLSAEDGKVHFADILLNFTGKSLDETNGELFGIHFAANNDSGVSELGIYSNVTATSVSDINSGWNSLQEYNDSVLGNGVTPKIGDLVYDDSYFDLDQATPTSISLGTKIGDIEFISNVNSLGLDFDFFGNAGSELIAFTFDKGLLPTGKALYHLAMECNNDMLAGHYESFSDHPNEVPTPAMILPAILGMFGAASRKKNDSAECSGF
ncbi:hypothetical protein Lepto7376_0909 [[Leptolyngbya] sp. PCC 7376]|uniref:PTPA-CTERM sorting domain-containing protein n=1 Tax=[Leptolyngbya] sp. PCC 7376 TaxID=111781 RepID=UPI00029EC59A|nr:PTPA-CTERM sorting domain-containing protein [[Leptolyngbya] sp. PCC 7376]AFY37283.1 hypothetical protein Lepto7376_0909 [[Leptolyngbya] sp. PCC 7376]